MASTSKCPYCNGVVKSDELTCPHCGAKNENYVVDTPRTIMAPTTIEELKEYCAERGMPLLRMRFFIGEDFKEPRAFGIFKKVDGTVVVYKNKADGTRAIRYEGPDEKKGVTELYLKLLDECHQRGIYPDTPDGKAPMVYTRQVKRNNNDTIAVVSVVLGTTIAILVTILALIGCYKDSQYASSHPNGYYQDNGKLYYHDTHWYEYDSDDGDWDRVSSGCDADAYEGTRWNTDWGSTAYSFEKSEAYDDLREEKSNAHSNDNGFDSWDSFDTDWDSDW